MTEQLVMVNGVELCLETFGDPTDPALLLISGAAASMDWWDVELCDRLASSGRFVIRYDHRDTGRSVASPAGEPSYTGDDLAADVLRILDALDVERAHLVGVSMGAGIAQDVAAHHPDRVLTITLIATTAAGDRSSTEPLPPPVPRIAATFAHPAPEPAWDDRDAVVDYLVEGERTFGGTIELDETRARTVAGIVFDRTRNMAASSNHWQLDGETSARFRLADIRVPTLVLHGTEDPLFPFAHGEALAAEIPGATLVALEGMGHQVPPPQLWDIVVPAIVAHTDP